PASDRALPRSFPPSGSATGSRPAAPPATAWARSVSCVPHAPVTPRCAARAPVRYGTAAAPVRSVRRRARTRARPCRRPPALPRPDPSEPSQRARRGLPRPHPAIQPEPARSFRGAADRTPAARVAACPPPPVGAAAAHPEPAAPGIVSHSTSGTSLSSGSVAVGEERDTDRRGPGGKRCTLAGQILWITPYLVLKEQLGQGE